MGFRFRQVFRLLPGVHLNVGKRGVSVSVGVRGAHVTTGTHGTRATVGLPGTGMSYTHHVKGDELRGMLTPAPSEPIALGSTKHWLWIAVILVLVMLAFGITLAVMLN